MSERPIELGDIVAVVRNTACCNGDNAVGRVHIVTGFHPSGQCTACRKITHAPMALLDGEYRAQPLSRLKRIDPPATGDTLPTRADAGIKERV